MQINEHPLLLLDGTLKVSKQRPARKIPANVDVALGEARLVAMLARADRIDREEGVQAYARYSHVLHQMADLYGFPYRLVVAAFCALSPNSDYVGNLRSTVSVLKGVRDGKTCQEIKVATYKHCRDRAYLYVTEAVEYTVAVRGPKITNFYWNLIDPMDSRWVTIDGHMVAIWRDENATMKDSLVRGKEYKTIKAAVQRVAFANYLIPNQLQATLWFTRKRLLNIKFKSQTSLFQQGDQNRTLWNVHELLPYE